MLGESEQEGVEIAEVSELAIEELEDEIKGLWLQLRKKKELMQTLCQKFEETEMKHEKNKKKLEYKMQKEHRKQVMTKSR